MARVFQQEVARIQCIDDAWQAYTVVVVDRQMIEDGRRGVRRGEIRRSAYVEEGAARLPVRFCLEEDGAFQIKDTGAMLWAVSAEVGSSRL